MRYLIPSLKFYERLYHISLNSNSKNTIRNLYSLRRLCSHVYKKQTERKSLLIGTHDGQFHCDEALACWMLKQLPKYSDATIIRTRDISELEKCDVAVDVGGVYNPETNRYDHHQRSFNETMKSLGGYNRITKLSSCGLIYYHMGKDVISELLQISKDDIVVEKLFKKLYSRFIEEVDAVDNSIDQFGNGKPRYQISTTIAARIKRLNPIWREINPDFNLAFEKAIELCGEEFKGQLNFLVEAWLPARKVVEDAFATRFSIDPSGEIIFFEAGGCPWEEHLFAIERENEILGKTKFVLYVDQSGEYRVHSVRKKFGLFGHRQGLPNQWCGLRDEELNNVAGISGCIFVHASGFIGGNKTFEGALEMARKSMGCGKS